MLIRLTVLFYLSSKGDSKEAKYYLVRAKYTGRGAVGGDYLLI